MGGARALAASGIGVITAPTITTNHQLLMVPSLRQQVVAMATAAAHLGDDDGLAWRSAPNSTTICSTAPVGFWPMLTPMSAGNTVEAPELEEPSASKSAPSLSKVFCRATNATPNRIPPKSACLRSRCRPLWSGRAATG